MKPRLTYTVAEAASLTGRCEWTIRDWIKKGVITSTKVAGSRLVHAASLHAAVGTDVVVDGSAVDRIGVQSGTLSGTAVEADTH